MKKKVILFLIAGTIGFLIDATVFFLFLTLFKLDFILCRILASIVAMVATWLINRNFAFRNQKADLSAHELGKYIMVSICGASTNLGILILTFQLDEKIYHLFSYGIAAMGGLIVNYVMYDRLVFKSRT
jgi:putative flippase GtrA